MDNPVEDDEFVVESSQAPTLRSNGRKDRKSYAAYFSMPRIITPRQRKPKPRKDRQKPSLTKNSGNLNDLNKENLAERNLPRNVSEEHILMSGTPFPAAPALFEAHSNERSDRCPSLDLFQHQEQEVSRYIFHQTESVQQEEQDLDRLLDGFKASYDVVSKRVTSTPYPSTADRTINRYDATTSAPLVDRPSRMESSEIVSDAQQLVSRRPGAYPVTCTTVKSNACSPDNKMKISCTVSTISNSSGEILDSGVMESSNGSKISIPVSRANLLSNGQSMTFANAVFLPPRTAVTTAATTTRRSRAECHASALRVQTEPLNLSKRFDAGSSRMDPGRSRTHRNSWSTTKCATEPVLHTVGEIGHDNNAAPEQKTNKPTVKHVAAQACRRPRCRNVGIQNQFENYFEMTSENIYSLAREIGANPEHLLRKMLKVSYSRMPAHELRIWQERTVFNALTRDDPNFPNETNLTFENPHNLWPRSDDD